MRSDGAYLLLGVAFGTSLFGHFIAGAVLVLAAVVWEASERRRKIVINGVNIDASGARLLLRPEENDHGA